MPLYEYQCPECGTFEVIQRFADAPLAVCPKCASAVEKLLSAPAIQFKGTGWYVTDYARKSSGNGNGKDKDKAKAGDTATADSKTASTSSATKDGTPAGGGTT